MRHLLGLATLGLAVLAAPAWSRPISAGASVSAASCTDADVFATLTDGSTTPFTRCAGPIDGNLTGNPGNIAAITADILSLFEFGADYLGASDASGNGPFTSDPRVPQGTLMLDQVLGGNFVLGLHGPNPGDGGGGRYTLYAFELADLGAVSLHFNMAGTSLNSRGVVQNLSHAALYGSPGDFDPPPSPPNDPPPSPPNGPPLVPQGDANVPEPGTLALAALGVAAAAVHRRRRRT